MKFKALLVFFLIFQLIGSALAQDKRKVALLPLQNRGAATDEWLTGGINYLLNNKLSVVSGFFLIEKPVLENAFKEIKYKRGPLNDRMAIQIGRITGADVTVSGTFIDSASQLNFVIYFHNTSNGKLIYRDEFHKSKDDLSGVADEIVRQLIHIAGIPVSPNEKALMARTLTRKPRALESFIKAYLEYQKNNNRPGVAIGLFKKAIQIDPSFWEAYYNLGILYFNSGQYGKARREFDKIIRALPNFDKPYFGRGLIYDKQKNYTAAGKDFQKVIDLNPNDYRAYYYLGKIERKQKHFKEARKYLNKGRDINPDYAPIYFEFGNILRNENQVRKSINDYRKAVELAPANDKYREILGEVYYRSQIYYNALNEFRTILKHNPSDAVANFMEGVTIYKQAVLEELVEAFLDILNDQGKGKAPKKKNTASMDPVKKRQVYQDMAAAFTKASQARPKFMQATFNLALTYMEMGDLKLAEKYFKKTIMIAPKLLKAYTKLAEVYEKTNRIQLAIEQYKKAFYLEPAIFVRNPTLGREQNYRNIFKEFMGDLNKRLKRNPHDIKANMTLAKVFMAQGLNGKAANLLRNVLSRQASNSEAKKLLSQIQKSRS